MFHPTLSTLLHGVIRIDFDPRYTDKKRCENVELFAAFSIDRNGSPHVISRSIEIPVLYREAKLQTGLAFAV